MPKQRILALLAIAFLAGHMHAAQVTNVIDSFATAQLIQASSGTTTNTVGATNGIIIGGYRTLVLGVSGTSPIDTFFAVDADVQQLLVAAPPNVTPSFQVIWGGIDGTTGLGGVALGGGQPLDLSTSVLSFPLVKSDLPNSFTWSFTDYLTNTATYNGSFPATNSSSVNISLASFSNAANVNWNAISFIVFSGGNVADLDLTLGTPVQVIAATVPEPETWALLVIGLALTTIVLCRRPRTHV
jgi:hypothetical protein